MERPIKTYIINQLKNHKRLSFSDTLILLIEIRRHIEENNLKAKYSIACFYCDWALHSYLDRNAFAQDALNEINLRLRNPILPYMSPQSCLQAIVDAIKYITVGEQFGEIITSIIYEPFDIDNHFMCNVIKCVVGIPFLIYDNPKSENNRKDIDNQISESISKWVNMAPSALISNMLTIMESQQRIVNFMFTNVCEEEMYYELEVKLENGDSRYGYIQFGK